MFLAKTLKENKKHKQKYWRKIKTALWGGVRGFMRFSSVKLLIGSVKTDSMLTKILIFIPDCPLPHNSSCNVHLADLTQLSGAPAVVVLLNITTLHQSLLGTWQVRIILSYSVFYKKKLFQICPGKSSPCPTSAMQLG